MRVIVERPWVKGGHQPRGRDEIRTILLSGLHVALRDELAEIPHVRRFFQDDRVRRPASHRMLKTFEWPIGLSDQLLH